MGGSRTGLLPKTTCPILSLYGGRSSLPCLLSQRGGGDVQLLYDQRTVRRIARGTAFLFSVLIVLSNELSFQAWTQGFYHRRWRRNHRYQLLQCHFHFAVGGGGVP